MTNEPFLTATATSAVQDAAAVATGAANAAGTHDVPLVATIAMSLLVALVLGWIAARLRMSPLVGYLMAGICVGPHTPGFVADTTMARQLADIGIMLLMLGVGLHFSVRDLWAVRRIAVPGAIGQILTATSIGTCLALIWGWKPIAGFVFGLSLSVASTVVLLRALENRKAVQTHNGRIAIGWLIVEDLAMIIALVLLPAIAAFATGGDAGVLLNGQETAPALPARPGSWFSTLISIVSLSFLNNFLPTHIIWVALGVTILKVAVFISLMLIVGRRALPWLLERAARFGSRELFTLTVLALALGIAYLSSVLFGVSVALGAFFAGVVMSESKLSHQAAEDTLPLKDAFAVLFFVSIGMLFDPTILIEEPLHVLSVVAVIVVGKSLAAFGIVLLFRYPVSTALTVSASLAQIGEFSFILGSFGISLGVLPVEGLTYILAGALISIAFNPVVFWLLGPIERIIRNRPGMHSLDKRVRRNPLSRLPVTVDESLLEGHAVIVGYGRVGSLIARAFDIANVPFVTIEENPGCVTALRQKGQIALMGDATDPFLLEEAHIARARLLIVAIPDSFMVRQVVQSAIAMNPGLTITARTHDESERSFLERSGVDRAIMGEQELGLAMMAFALRNVGMDDASADKMVDDFRVGLRPVRETA
ncbi:cation:proton antiporter [Phaeovibrio sulfidiphilus]|uniref:Cation:proton antiporter n=1 Tax=Phaeovibrio sulfidiphilus TaxID=1220600 RepID=A0A8J7CDB1_9PROT|nr:cation:proton antiporter [Phaeovibrio sulfidiphilus]MBE1236904.1 cation:proton antiporter [Phaeovibrio sulfidiphilus]